MTHKKVLKYIDVEKINLIIIKNVSIFDGISIQKNKNVIISGDKIIDIKSSIKSVRSKSNDIKVIDGRENLLIPGFIDIQVNGGGGALFNRTPTALTLKTIFQAHLKYGTTSIFPTFISDSFETLKSCIAAIEQNIHNPQYGIAGFHIEGPLINVEKRGIHPKENISKITAEIKKILLDIKIPHCLITLAPEVVEEKFIQGLVKKKLNVFAGHTNASSQIMNNAIKNGVSGVTHLFNACSQMTAREAGVVGASLLDKNILCSIIADGIHVSYDMLKIAFKLKDTGKFVLVSDAMESIGINKKKFKLFDETIYVNKNTLQNKDGTLAGAHLTMLWSFQNILKNKLVNIEEAICMTSTNQANHFKLKNKGAVLPGYDANVILIDKNNFELLEVIFLGNCSSTKIH